MADKQADETTGGGFRALYEWLTGETLLMMGEIDRLLALEPPRVVAGADDGIRVIGLGLAGRRDEARRRLLDMRQSSRIPVFQTWIEYLMAWLDRSASMAGGHPNQPGDRSGV